MAIVGDFALIEEYGILRAPVATRHLPGKLWDIKAGDGRQQRVLYCLEGGDCLVVLHAFRKQRAGAQRGDVELAMKRMREVRL